MGERSGLTKDGEAIAGYIRRFANPPLGEIEAFVAQGRPLSLAAGAAFIAQGDDRHRLGFIHEGVVRYHLLQRDGEDVTKDFGFPGWFSVSYGSAVRRAPARVAISAVSPCRLTVWPFERLSQLLETCGEWQRLGLRIAEMLYLRKEDREISLLTEDAGQRYRALQRQFPNAVELIPHYYLASYLGVRPQSLSRIRGALRRAGASSAPAERRRDMG